MLNAERDNKFLAKKIIYEIYRDNEINVKDFCKRYKIDLAGFKFVFNKINSKSKEVALSKRLDWDVVYIKYIYKDDISKKKLNEIVDKFKVPKRNSFTVAKDCIYILETLYEKPRSVSSLASKYHLYCPQSWIRHLVQICLNNGAEITAMGSILSFNNTQDFTAITNNLLSYNPLNEEKEQVKAVIKKEPPSKDAVLRILRRYDWEMKEAKQTIRYMCTNLDLTKNEASEIYWQIRRDYIEKDVL